MNGYVKSMGSFTPKKSRLEIDSCIPPGSSTRLCLTTHHRKHTLDIYLLKMIPISYILQNVDVFLPFVPVFVARFHSLLAGLLSTIVVMLFSRLKNIDFMDSSVRDEETKNGEGGRSHRSSSVTEVDFTNGRDSDDEWKYDGMQVHPNGMQLQTPRATPGSRRSMSDVSLVDSPLTDQRALRRQLLEARNRAISMNSENEDLKRDLASKEKECRELEQAVLERSLELGRLYTESSELRAKAEESIRNALAREARWKAASEKWKATAHEATKNL